MIAKDIYDDDFGDGCIGWATNDHINRLMELDLGTVLVPDERRLHMIPVLRRTRLELIPVEDPQLEWEKYRASSPSPNETRLAFVKKQRDQYQYSDLQIHPFASIGDAGMGFEWENGWLEFPQLGGVTMGKGVRVDAFSTIKRGTVNNTIIGDGCKIGSHCNIGHNVVLGRNCLLTSHISIAGSCVVGNNCFIGQGVMIKNKVRIGDNCIIGQGANIVKDVPDNTTVVGLWK